MHPDVFKEVFGETLVIHPQNYQLGWPQEKWAGSDFESCLSVLSCISKSHRRPSTNVPELIRLISCLSKRVGRSRKLYCILIFSLPRGSDFGLDIIHRVPQFIPVKQINQLFLQLRRMHSRDWQSKQGSASCPVTNTIFKQCITVLQVGFHICIYHG